MPRPPEMARFVGGLERRAYRLVELRADGAGATGVPTIAGHAAVFDQPSEELGFWMPFRETIARGAFKKTIKEADVRALFNHDPNFVLGRNKAKTLTLREDEVGLAIEAMPPDTGWARDLMASMSRGDIDQMSFGFEVVKDTWTENHDTHEVTRTLNEVRLFDVSVVTFPAYPQTDAAVRSLLTERGVDYDALSRVLARSKAGALPMPTDAPLITATLDALRALMPEPDGHHGQPPEPHHSLDRMRRALALAEAEA